MENILDFELLKLIEATQNSWEHTYTEYDIEKIIGRNGHYPYGKFERLEDAWRELEFGDVIKAFVRFSNDADTFKSRPIVIIKNLNENEVIALPCTHVEKNNERYKQLKISTKIVGLTMDTYIYVNEPFIIDKKYLFVNKLGNLGFRDMNLLTKDFNWKKLPVKEIVVDESSRDSSEDIELKKKVEITPQNEESVSKEEDIIDPSSEEVAVEQLKSEDEKAIEEPSKEEVPIDSPKDELVIEQPKVSWVSPFSSPIEVPKNFFSDTSSTKKKKKLRFHDR